MRLEAEVGAAHRGPRAEVGDAVVPVAERLLLDLDPDRVDAACRPQMVAEAQVRGGKSDRAPALVAHLDAALDLEGAPEQDRRLARLARREILADLGRRINRAA